MKHKEGTNIWRINIYIIAVSSYLEWREFYNSYTVKLLEVIYIISNQVFIFLVKEPSNGLC